MRKYLLSLLLALAVVAGIIVLFPKRTVQLHADALVGEDTELYLCCPNVSEALAAWKKTALYDIGQEPEIQEFLKKPKSRVCGIGSTRNYVKAFRLAAPQEFFLAATSLSPTPRMVSGALCMGDKAKLESALAEAALDLQKSVPEGQLSRTRHKGVDIEMFTSPRLTLATAWVGRWMFLANDLDLLKSTLERAQGHVARSLLKNSPKFTKGLAHVPPGSEFIAFATTPAGLGGLLPPALTAKIPVSAREPLAQIESVSFGVKFEGKNIRDSIFAATAPSSSPSKSPTLSRKSLRLTTPDTLLYCEGELNWPWLSQCLLTPPADPTAQLPPAPAGIVALRDCLASQGIASPNFAQMLGDEFGLSVDWPAQALQPSLTLSLELHDPNLATKTIEFLVGGQLGNTSWNHTQQEGAEVFDLSIFPLLKPTVAIKADKLIFGLEPNVVLTSLESEGKEPGLTKSALFKETSERLIKPTLGFGYLDAKSLFERLYGLSRPLLMLWGGIHPVARELIDVSKLPSTESISAHLTPIAYSASRLPDGFLAESIGPVSFTQSALGIGVGAGAALAPFAKSWLSKGLQRTGGEAEAQAH